jgi:transmembrane sensor
MSRAEDRIAREASEWLARLNSPSISLDTLREFYAWRRGPGHADAFLEAETIWEHAGDLAADPEIAFAVQDVLSRPARRPRPQRSLWSRRAALVGGISAAAAGIAGYVFWPRTFSTAVGEQRLVMLDDGSRVHINTDSRLRVALTEAARTITLDRGEAWFDVAHDPARPFTVRSDWAQVRAIGTSFSVRKLSTNGASRIVLAEGRVEVRVGESGLSRDLTPSQVLEVHGQEIGPTASGDLDQEMAWRQGRISFRDLPLEQAIAEVNRYAAKPIRLDVPTLANSKVNGVFATGDSAAFVTAVTTLFPLRPVARSDGGIDLTRRDEPPA